MVSSVSSQHQKKHLRSNSEGLFLVDKVLDKRTVKGSVQYLIQWKGYGKKYNTWEHNSMVKRLSMDVNAFETMRAKPGKASNIESDKKRFRCENISNSMKNTSKYRYLEKKLAKPLVKKTKLKSKGCYGVKNLARLGTERKINWNLRNLLNKRKPTQTIIKVTSKSGITDKLFVAKYIPHNNKTPVMVEEYVTTELSLPNCLNQHSKIDLGNQLTQKDNALLQYNMNSSQVETYSFMVQEALIFISAVISKHGKGFASGFSIVLAVILYIQVKYRPIENIDFVYQRVTSASIPMDLFFKLRINELIYEDKCSDKSLIEKLIKDVEKY